MYKESFLHTGDESTLIKEEYNQECYDVNSRGDYYREDEAFCPVCYKPDLPASKKANFRVFLSLCNENWDKEIIKRILEFQQKHNYKNEDVIDLTSLSTEELIEVNTLMEELENL